MSWGPVNARSRGLATHLMPRRQLDALARVADLDALAAELQQVGFLVPEADAGPAALELAVRRRAATELRRLDRWCEDEPALRTIIYEDEERRSLRALVRGALASAPAESRMVGLIPTPALPERALSELARQPTPATVAALLVAWRHPCGAALRREAAGAEPDALRLEVQLNRVFAQRITLAASRAGGGRLRAYVRELIDIENVLAAIVLAEQAGDVTPKDMFLAGGERVSIGVFEQAIATERAPLAGARLALAFGTGAIATTLRRHEGLGSGLERAVLQARIAALRDEARRDPLGPAPVLGFALRLRAQSLDLRRLIWGTALAAPAAVLSSGLVTS